MKIMIIEDDLIIANAIEKELLKWSYSTFVCRDFTRIIKDFQDEKPNLVLLDINLPQVNGYYLCTEIRKLSNVPIIFISALSEKSDILSAMQMGADDYIIKPIDLNITVAKIQALLRRTYEMNGDFDSLFYKELSLNISKSCLFYNNNQLELTFTELQIIRELFKNPETFVSKSKLIENCWKNEDFIDENTLAVNLSAMQMGADDYIIKPIDLNITVAKIQALLRRTYEMNGDFDSLFYKELSLNISKSCLFYNNNQLELTFTELQIIRELFKNPETFVSKSKLIENCWKNEDFIDENTLAVNLSRMRKKLSKIGLESIIETKKNLGYRLFIKEGRTDD